MRVIVFDRELHEPLTVIDMPHDVFERAKRGQRICFAVSRQLNAADFRRQQHDAPPEFEHVQLELTPVWEGGRVGDRDRILYWTAYADNPEAALLLRSTLLPGQLGDLERRGLRLAFGL
jgi:hypothetical protein